MTALSSKGEPVIENIFFYNTHTIVDYIYSNFTYFSPCDSEDSGIGVSNTSIRSSPINSTMEDVGILSPINSGIDEIGKKAHDLIERINERRAMDQHEMNSFEEKLIKKVLITTDILSHNQTFSLTPLELSLANHSL